EVAHGIEQVFAPGGFPQLGALLGRVASVAVFGTRTGERNDRLLAMCFGVAAPVARGHASQCPALDRLSAKTRDHRMPSVVNRLDHDACPPFSARPCSVAALLTAATAAVSLQSGTAVEHELDVDDLGQQRSLDLLPQAEKA